MIAQQLTVKDKKIQCDTEECEDEVSVETCSDGKGHASQEGAQGSSER